MKTKHTRSRPATPTEPVHTDAAEATRSFEKRIASSPTARMYTLRLFVTGNSPKSTAAISTIRSICDTYLPGKFELEVVDIYQQPATAVDEQIIAAPTLIKQRPKPVRRMVGSLSDRDRVLVGLGIALSDAPRPARAGRS